MAKILTIEDEENLRFSIVRSLSRAGHDVAESDCATDAWRLTRDVEFDLILTDVNLDGDNGVELVKKLRAEGFEGAIIVMTAYGTVENAVEAMKLGADDYLQKPISLEELSIIIERALEQRRVRSRLALYQRLEQRRLESRGVIGQSEAWLETLTIADRFAEIPIAAPGASAARQLTTILLLGETGVGKGLLARYIHDRHERMKSKATNNTDNRDDTPFVHVNCSALPPALVESELFGHEKGAFTDAKTAKAGLFELAEGGTIFLDEIGEMPLELQAKLLLVLEEGSFRRVGGSKVRHVRARVIAATNQLLEKQIEAGRFRRDLFYRLSAFTIVIPPLRERDEDVVLLANSMLEQVAREYARPGATFGDEAAIALKNHAWPGNVRELINVIQRAVMLCHDEVITETDLGLGLRTPMPSVQTSPAAAKADANGHIVFDFDRGLHTIDEVEKELIRQALVEAQGNVSKAARLVGMNRSSFRYRIERCGLEDFVQEVAR